MKKIEICLTPELLHLYTIEGKNVVIVDIFRATTTMMAALANGVNKLIPVADLETCRSYADKGFVIAGERNGLKAEGFELGNSPLAYMDNKYAGQNIAMTTTNGTAAIEKTKKEAANVILGAFVNLSATVKYLNSKAEDVLIVCAGWKGKFNLEDALYAGALATKLHPHFKLACDTGVAMSSLYQGNAHRLQLFLSQASHTKRLQNNNIEADIDFCLKEDLYTLIGIVRDDVLVGEEVDASFQKNAIFQ